MTHIRSRLAARYSSAVSMVVDAPRQSAPVPAQVVAVCVCVLSGGTKPISECKPCMKALREAISEGESDGR